MGDSEVVIEPGLAGRLAGPFAGIAERGRLFIVADAAAWSAHGERMLTGLAPLARNLPEPLLVPPGEASKSWPQLIALVDSLLGQGIARSDTILAFGGGMVGDLAGFAAAIVKRGCGFVQVPTSLLAQVDSAVGGKTGINTAHGKNLVGAFHAPRAVLVDPELLASLDPRHLRAGYAEIVKYGLIDEPAFFAWLEENGHSVLALEPGPLLHAIRSSIAAKLRTIAGDESDLSGKRALLNLGHTFGHALESVGGYALLHGEAVAIGMVLAFRFSERRGLCPPEDSRRVAAHLASVGLPTGFAADPGRLVAAIRHDKKAAAGRSAFVLARGVGAAFLDRDVDLEEVQAFLAEQSAGTREEVGAR